MPSPFSDEFHTLLAMSEDSRILKCSDWAPQSPSAATGRRYTPYGTVMDRSPSSCSSPGQVRKKNQHNHLMKIHYGSVTRNLESVAAHLARRRRIRRLGMLPCPFNELCLKC